MAPTPETPEPTTTPAESSSIVESTGKVAFTEVVTEGPPEKKDDPPAAPNESTKPTKKDKSKKKKKKTKAPSISSSSSSSSGSDSDSDSDPDDASTDSDSDSDGSSSSSSSLDSNSDDELDNPMLARLKPKVVKSMLKQSKKALEKQMKELEKSMAQAEKRAKKEKLKKAEKKAEKKAAKEAKEATKAATKEPTTEKPTSDPTDPDTTANAEAEIAPSDAVSSAEKKLKKDKKKRKKHHKGSHTGLDGSLASLEASMASMRRHRAGSIGSQDPDIYKQMLLESAGLSMGRKEKVLPKASVLDFKRVDKRYNKTRFTFEIVDSSNAPTIDKYRQYLFTVRRIFDWDNKYVNSKVDIKSRSLKELLRRTMGEIKGISLVEDTPSIDPNMLFNYVKEMEAEVERLEGVVEAKKKVEEGKPKIIEVGDVPVVEKTEGVEPKVEKTEEVDKAEDSTSTVTVVKEKKVKDKDASKPVDEDNKKKSKKEKKDKKSKKEKSSKSKSSKKDKKKSKKKEPPATPENIIAHGKVLLRYLDEDYKSTKSSLFPLLSAGLITFDLLWAVFKPNTLVYTVCPGTDEPRAFIVEYTEKHSSIMRGTWFAVEGRYLEFVGLPEDHKKGKIMQVTETGGKGGFGWGKCTVEIDSFTGSRRVDSLRCYPMSYRDDEEEMKKRLVERGRKFVGLAGMQYKRHKGLAFMRNKKGQIIKVNLNGRIMIDPALFRRLNPNYIVSSVRPRSADVKTARDLNIYTSDKDGRFRRVGEDSDSESDGEGKCGCGDSEDEGVEKEEEEKEDVEKFFFDENGKLQVYNPDDLASRENDAETIGEGTTIGFTDDEFMLASSVVLGFSFPEKLWLEISVAGVQDIEWNDSAFDTLVLPASQKEIVKALVETHTGSRMESTTIDDIIQGKGRGLVTVLHGPPGTGKTLTAESIAELLHKPLYMVSSGELGTSAHTLEEGLNRILDIAHTWDAVLLLDEADVFLEKRTMHDLHRNALVSVFLRLLEYFQGILFLTTNRVQSFDEAFQSRIHVALRYDELTFAAKKQIWCNFIAMVREKERANGLAAVRAANKAEEAATKREQKKVKSSGESSASSVSSRRSRREESPRGDEILSESDMNMLAAKPFNGRQIKNIVRTAQSLAASKNMPLAITHIKQVIAVAESFDNDLKGGTGYIENLRSYA